MRQTAIEERTHIINSLRGHLKVYGIKFSKKAGKGFREMVEKAVMNLSPRIQRVVHSLLNILDTLNQEIQTLNKEVEGVAASDEDVQLLQTIDGVSPLLRTI